MALSDDQKFAGFLKARADAWFSRYDQMPASLRSALDQAGEVSVDVDPVFSFPEIIR